MDIFIVYVMSSIASEKWSHIVAPNYGAGPITGQAQLRGRQAKITKVFFNRIELIINFLNKIINS